eukprot:gene14952-14749_t
MVVVVILGILATLVVPKIMGRPDEARVVAAKQDIASVMQALNLYRLDNSRYPTTEQGLQALVAPPTTEPVPRNYKQGGYLSRLPVDPWGSNYQFLSPGINGEVDVMSFGADGKAGGEGQGFTLLELLVVIVVLSIAAGLIVVRGTPGDSNYLESDAKKLSQLLRIAQQESLLKSKDIRFVAGDE